MLQAQNNISIQFERNTEQNLSSNHPQAVFQNNNQNIEHSNIQLNKKYNYSIKQLQSKGKNDSRDIQCKQTRRKEKTRQQNQDIKNNKQILSQSFFINSMYKCKLISKIICRMLVYILVILGIIGICVYFLIPKEQQSQFIVNRTLKKYTVRVSNVSSINTMKTQKSDEQIIRINYTFIIVIKQNKGKQIDCICSIQKLSQQILTLNGTVIQTQIFDQSSNYIDILKRQAVNSTDDSQSIDINIYQPISKSYDTSSFHQNQSIKFITPVFPVFKFSLRDDGSIINITFPKQTEKQLLGLLKGFIKMFSPLSKQQIYSQGNNTRKVQKINGNIISQRQKYTNKNQTFEQNLSYFEQNIYNYEKYQNGSTILKIESKINSIGPSHNTTEVTSQQNYFNQDDELQKCIISSQTVFSSSIQQHDDNSSSINLTSTITSFQKAQMIFKKSFQTQNQSVQQYEDFIKNYQQKNQTFTFNSQQLVNYILNNNNDEVGNPGQILIKQNHDGSLTLENYGKVIKVLSTNILGCRISIYGVTKINILLEKNKKNQHLKYPIIDVYIGNILNLGFFKFQSPLLQYEKYFDPLTLKFTLQQIQNVFNIFKESFLKDIGDIQKLIISGNFQKNIFPSIVNITQLLLNIQNAIVIQMDLWFPIQILQKIFLTVNNIQQIIETKGVFFLDSKNNFINNISKQLLKFVDVGYDDTLKIFNEVKPNLTAIKIKGNNYLQNTIETFVESEMFKIGYVIKQLVPQQVQQQYKQQMQKAKQIINFITYVRQNGLLYREFLINTLIDHKQNYLQFSEKIINSYFKNQSLILTKSKYDTLNCYSNVKTQFENLSYSFSQNLQIGQNKSQLLFESILHQKFISSYFSLTYTNRIVEIFKISAYLSNEVGGDCCRYKRTWYGRKYCATWNPSKNNQKSQFTRYKILYDQVTVKFFSLAQQTQSLVKSLQVILKSKKSLLQKYQQLITMKQQITKDSNNYIDEVIQKITIRKNDAVYIRSTVLCGGTINLDYYIVNLNLILSLSTELKVLFLQFKQNYTKVVDYFKPQIFILLVQNTRIVQNALNFFNAYDNITNRTINHIQQIEDIVITLNPQQFVNSTKFINNISNLHNSIRQDLIEPCLNKQKQLQTINLIRKQYLSKFQKIKDIQDQFFDNELKKLKQYLDTSSKNIFSAYLQIDLCEIYQFFNNTIANLEPDFDNLKILLNTFKSFIKVKSTVEFQLKNRFKQINELVNSFYNLFTPEGYRQLINSTQNITTFLQTLVFNTSQQLSILKQQSKSVYILNCVDVQYLSKSIDIFIQSQFTLDYNTMFLKYDKMRQVSQTIVDKLNFDIIDVVVQGKQILQHYSKSINTYQQGLLNLKQQFQIITSGFLNINTLTTQDTLNNLDSRYNNMIISINKTLFGTFFTDFEYIKNKYMHLQFKSKSLKSIHTNSLAKLNDFSMIVSNVKQTVNEDMSKFSIKQLINKIQIVSLSSLGQLGNSIGKQFQSFKNIFKQSIKQILNYKSLVQKDFKNLLKFPKMLIQIQKKIQKQYEHTYNFIKTITNQTQSSLNKNSSLYSKFKKSDVYKQIQNLTQELDIQFANIWDEKQDLLQEINYIFQGISKQVLTVMNQMNQAKLKIQTAIKSVKARINNVNQQFKIIKGKLFNLEQLIFINSQKDLDDIIKNSLRSILQQIENISNVYFSVIMYLNKSISNEKLSFIRQTLDKTNSNYDYLKQSQKDFIEGMNQALKSIQNFIKTDLSKKIKSLKQGIIFIRALTNMSNIQQTFRVWQKSLHSLKNPIYSQMIPTNIGVFVINFDINLFTGISAVIDLLQKRNLDIGVTITTTFQIQASFSYSHMNTVEFGIYINNTFLKSILNYGFFINNFIPIQLVEPIVNIPQIYSDNVASLRFILNLTIQAVQIQIGYFIKQIQVQLIWLRTKFCFNQRFLKFCINQKIPIGSRFIYKRNNFGQLISNEPIKNKIIIFQQRDPFQI